MKPRFAELRHQVQFFMFDLDDTLAKTLALSWETTLRFFREKARVNLSEADHAYFRIHSWKKIAENFNRVYGLNFLPEELETTVVQRKAEMMRNHPLRTATGLLRTMSLPVRKAIVSGSGREEIRSVLRHIGIEDRFDPILSVDDFSYGKPDPAGYRMALTMANVAPEASVVFEDSETGVLSAQAAGCSVVFLREFATADLTGLADFSFDDLDAFCDAWGNTDD